MDDAAALSRTAGIRRRTFLKTTAAAGAGLALSGWGRARAQPQGREPINVALVGCGAQGLALAGACLQLPDVRFRAVCDIWDHNLRRGSRLLQCHGHAALPYGDYGEMLAIDADLDAVIVATPTWMHAPHAIAALEAGKHVYCEQPMANSIGEALRMEASAKGSGMLLQIGYHRRSDPRLLCLRDLLADGSCSSTRVIHAASRRNLAGCDPRGWPARHSLSGQALERHGYTDMNQFRNWHWYGAYGGGLTGWGADQIDMCNWLLGAEPCAAMASGGGVFPWRSDNAVVVYEYDTPRGRAGASHRMQVSAGSPGFLVRLLCEVGAVTISEDAHGRLECRCSGTLASLDLPSAASPTVRHPHLHNFFEAIRTGVALACPPEAGLATTAALAQAGEALAMSDIARTPAGDCPSIV